jgi:hypothetical protein
MDGKMSIEHWWNDTDGENQITWRKTCPIVTLSTRNPTCGGLGLNLVVWWCSVCSVSTISTVAVYGSVTVHPKGHCTPTG